MISRIERKQRKKKAIEAIMFAYCAIDKLDEILNFNKGLMRKASDIKFRLACLQDQLTPCTQKNSPTP